MCALTYRCRAEELPQTPPDSDSGSGSGLETSAKVSVLRVVQGFGPVAAHTLPPLHDTALDRSHPPCPLHPTPAATPQPATADKRQARCQVEFMVSHWEVITTQSTHYLAIRRCERASPFDVIKPPSSSVLSPLLSIVRSALLIQRLAKRRKNLDLNEVHHRGHLFTLDPFADWHAGIHCAVPRSVLAGSSPTHRKLALHEVGELLCGAAKAMETMHQFIRLSESSSKLPQFDWRPHRAESKLSKGKQYAKRYRT